MSKKLPNKSLLSISQAAEVLGVSTDTLRRLDKKGKFKPKRDDNGKRYYSPKDIELLKQIFEKSGPYTPSEAASILNISVDSLRRWEKQGKIEGYRTPSGHRRFTQEAIDSVKGTKHKPINKKQKDIEDIKKELSKVKKETEVIKKDAKEEKPSDIVRLIHSQRTKTKEVLPLSFLLVVFVIVSSLLIGIAQLAGAVSTRLLPHQTISDAQLDGQVLAVDTEGGSAVLLSQVLDENFNFSVNGYVEGSQIRSTTSDSAPLSVQSSTKVTNLNADLLDGNDFSDLPSLITGTVNNFSLTGSSKQLKLSTSTSDPTALGAGSLYFNSSTNKLKIYNGTSWENVDTGTSSLWTDGGGYVYPTDGEKLGNDSSGGSNKLSGIYLSDSSPIYFGTDNDWNASAAGSDLNFSDGSSTLVAMKDKGSYAFLNVKGKSTTGDPSSCSEGDIYYNAQDDSVRICHSGNTWEALDGSASSISFADITTGTNSSATMTIGTGASLTFSGSGTLNASSLNSLTSSQFLRSDTSDTFSSGTLSIDSGATLDVNGDLSVADTDIAFDGASTTFTFTGAATLSSSSITATGDLAVNGGDLTTNQTTFNLLNTTPTTLNIGGAATTLELGAATGTTSINNALTVDGNTTLGNATADTITFTARSASDLLPITDNVYDLGSASLQWADIRGTAIYQNGNQVCDSGGTGCPTGAGPWDETSSVVHLDTTSNLVSIGNSTTEHKLEVEGAVTGKALVSLWEKGDQDILVASNSGTPTNVFRITNDGSVVSGGDVAVNGGDITTTQTTFNLLNTTPTTLNIGGAATTLSLGAGTGTTTVNNALTVTGTLTANGDVDLGNATGDTITFTGRVDSDILPATDNTYDLGSASLQFAEIRGVAIYQNGNQVCDTTGNCTGGDAGPWDETTGVVHLDTTSNLVSIGDSTTEHKLEVEGAVTGKALVSLWEKGDQDILVASNSGTPTNVFRITNDGSVVSGGDVAVNGGDITSTQTAFNLINTNATTLNIGGAATTIELGAATGTTSINNSLTVDGDITLGDAATDTLTFTARAGSDLLPITDNTYDLGSASLQWADIRGTAIYQNGNLVCDSSGSNCPSGGDAGPWNETTGVVHLDTASNLVSIGTSSTDFKLGIEGAVAGKALVGLNETGDQDILTASASGTTVANLDRSGNLQIEGTLSDLTDTVLTIDDSIQLNGDAILDSGGTTRMDFNTGTNVIRLTGSEVRISGDLAVNGGDITTNQTTLNIDVADGGTFNFRDGTNNLVQITDQGTTGRLAVSDSLQVGSTTTLAYSRFGTGTTGHSGNLSSASDVLLQDLEVDGTLFLDGGTLANSAGTASLILTSSPTTGENSLSASSWLVENTANLGKAALMVNQTKGGDLFTASQSGTTKFRIENNGNVTIDGSGTMLTVGGGAGKIDVGTVDPVYNIGGTKYATYMAGMIGVKEEVTGSVKTSEYVPGLGYKQTIDFAKQEKGSDLWLFAKATDIEKHINNLIVLLSPSENTRAWYEVDPNRYTLSIYTSRPTSVSYRITAPRFDAALWTNYNDNPNSTGFMVEDKELSVNEGGEIEGQDNNYLNSLSIENTNQSGDFFENLNEYNLLDNEGNIIHHIEAFSKLLVANIKAGAIQTENLATKGFYSFQGTIDNLLITSGLVSPSVKTAEISPLPGESDVSVTLGDKEKESGFGELIINNSSGSAVARVDSEGNAEFDGKVKADSFEANNASVSGNLYAGKIYADEIVGNTATDSATTLAKIEELLKKAEEDQKLLTESSTWDVNTATNSAKLDTLTASSLYITGTALISSLSVSESFTLGSDFVIENNSINTLERPLLIQSLASAPVEIMGGKVRIDTAGNVQIDGNLFVAGRIEAKEAVLSSTETSDIFSVRLGEQRTATISSEGKGSFSSIATDSITGGENIRDSVSVAPGQTSVSIQKDWDEAPVSVLVTPTYSTQAWVSDISEKGFTINLSESPNEEQKVFWWAIW